MFIQVEAALIQAVKDSPLGKELRTVGAYSDINAGDFSMFVAGFPGVYIALTGAEFRPITQSTVRVDASYMVLAGSRHLGSQTIARTGEGTGAYVALQALIELLYGSKLGLDGISSLQPGRLYYKGNTDLLKSGVALYAIEFATSWEQTVVDDEADAPMLTKIGIEYFLKPGDEVADASDELTLNEQGDP